MYVLPHPYVPGRLLVLRAHLVLSLKLIFFPKTNEGRPETATFYMETHSILNRVLILPLSLIYTAGRSEGAPKMTQEMRQGHGIRCLAMDLLGPSSSFSQYK